MTPTARPAAASPDGALGRDFRVLVVDDSAVFRTGMCRAVQACDGLELAGQAGGGEEALVAIAALAPDLVILDLRMPDLDGTDVLRRLAVIEPSPRCRVLVISATLDDEARDEALAAGADACLSKALSRSEICATALELLRG